MNSALMPLYSRVYAPSVIDVANRLPWPFAVDLLIGRGGDPLGLPRKPRYTRDFAMRTMSAKSPPAGDLAAGAGAAHDERQRRITFRSEGHHVLRAL